MPESTASGDGRDVVFSSPSDIANKARHDLAQFALLMIPTEMKNTFTGDLILVDIFKIRKATLLPTEDREQLFPVVFGLLEVVDCGCAQLANPA